MPVKAMWRVLKRRWAGRWLTIGTCVFGVVDGGKVDAYPTSEPVAVRDYTSLMPLTGRRGALAADGQPFWLEAVVDAAAATPIRGRREMVSVFRRVALLRRADVARRHDGADDCV